MTFWETITAGEYVIFALALLFIATVWIWWARAAKLHKEHKGYSGMINRLHDYITEGDLESAAGMCSAISTPGGRAVSAGLGLIGNPMSQIKGAMDEIETGESLLMERGVGWLKGIAIMSPLIGAAGTLCGICDRLRDLGQSVAEVSPAMICGSLAPTVVTTIAGLGVGVFAIIAWISLDGSVGKAKRKLTDVCQKFRDILNAPS